jgi:glycerophosphoryl diester phosphodiesterase
MLAFSYVLMLAALLVLWRGLLWRGRPVPGVLRVPPLLIGHRGVRGPLPENGLPAFRMALREGLDGLETDVQRTRDGVLVLFHDGQLDGVPLVDWSYRSLLGRVPDLTTLDELLALVRQHPGVLLNVELKTTLPSERSLLGLAGAAARSVELALAVARPLLTSGLVERLIVSSFDPLALLALRLRAPSLRTAYLWSDEPATARLLRRPWPAGWLHVDALHPRWSRVDAELVAYARRRRLALNVWTVNDAAEVRRLLALGASGIMADDPAALLEAAGGRPGGGAAPAAAERQGAEPPRTVDPVATEEGGEARGGFV